MAPDLAHEFLVVSRFAESPAQETVTRALLGVDVRVAEYVPAHVPVGPSSAAPSATGRQRRATYRLTPPPGVQNPRVVVAQSAEPALAGMGEGAFAALTRGLAPDDTQTARTGTLSLTLRLTSSEAAAAAALNWALTIARVLLDLTDGILIDLAAQRCQSRDALVPPQADGASADVLRHVAFHNVVWNAESRWLHTHGLQKFGRPELDLVAVPVSLLTEGSTLLREVAASLASGSTLVAGQEIALEDVGAAIAVGAPADEDHQAPFGRLRLYDAEMHGASRSTGIGRLLMRVALAEATRFRAQGAIARAAETLDRILAANPDDCAALSLQAEIALDAGQTLAALDIGELMELRVPADYRGPLIIGNALAALGRQREALHALNRAVEREPEAAAAYALRAQVHARLGADDLAAIDRTHAKYLGGFGG